MKGWVPPKLMVLKPPPANASRQQLDRLHELIYEIRVSTDIVYFLTHCRIAQALMDAHQLKVKVLVFADYKERMSLSCHLPELLRAGIPRFVKPKKSTPSAALSCYMQHDKTAVFDQKLAWAGSGTGVVKP